jgi:hypothetical protein
MNDIDEYLRANRDAFTREALTRRLVESGHDPAEVDAAWARIERGSISHAEAGPARVEAPKGRVGIGTSSLVVLTVLVYGISILAAFAAIQYGGGVSILMIVYVIAMVFALASSVRRVRSAPTRRSGWAPIWGAVGISFVIFVGLSGACFALLAPASSIGRAIL